MGKSHTEAKLMRVGFQEFERLQQNLKHRKTFKIRKDELVSKVYFIYFDDEKNLHFIGKNSQTGKIDKTALMREISEGQDISQINSQLIALIDRHKPTILDALRLLLFVILVLLIFILSGFAASAFAGIFPAYPVISLVCLTVALSFGMTAMGSLGYSLTSLNMSSIFEKLYITAGGFALGAGIGASIGTIIAPGIGTLIGAVLGAVLTSTVFTTLLVIDHLRKKADNPPLIQQLTESLAINEPIGVPVKIQERKFFDNKSRYDYGDYREQYTKLFPSIKQMEKQNEEIHNESRVRHDY